MELAASGQLLIHVDRSRRELVHDHRRRDRTHLVPEPCQERWNGDGFIAALPAISHFYWLATVPGCNDESTDVLPDRLARTRSGRVYDTSWHRDGGCWSRRVARETRRSPFFARGRDHGRARRALHHARPPGISL